MNHDPFAWGRPDDATYGRYNEKIAYASNQPTTNTTQPIVTGTSVLAMKYKGGVVIAADNLASYGSLLRFNGIERLIKVGQNTVVGVSGDVSDMQHIERLLEEIETDNNYDNTYSESFEQLQPSYVFKYLSAVMYSRRSKMNPLWNAIIVAGVENGAPFMRYVNLLGVTYTSPTLATGFGAHLANPLMRRVVDREEDVANTTREAAVETIKNCMKVLYYRDARSAKSYSLAVIDCETGVSLEHGIEVDNMVWGFAKDIKGYGTQKV
ncbi:hypothetical protein TBLA_0E00150 [Henningerozyma blattae CBS 6284]|uniref:Proteasome subunit beta n=1 Tax=Henningerozyma blattae (strain ATCC 34711 / CBS 6284 / DSM 70876 / NBRC 10599 / NRRL Y-10934 / UCD 77-7) TaxID=1071380 RepID=I2H3X6_HENB6|nr:hypothetical protein TBLA_0E00150 [Tetrapisispora blattae CBS 6284]CCH61078.1 hypothetical protein TBLA_0E00150 [Tetrapisispora blattae CBS 6284]